MSSCGLPAALLHKLGLLLHRQAVRAWMPRDARTTRPEAISCGTTRRTVSTPIAKPRPADVPELVKIACRQHRVSGVLEQQYLTRASYGWMWCNSTGQRALQPRRQPRCDARRSAVVKHTGGSCQPASRTVLTPMTRPAMSSSGPPLLPGLMAASVWMAPAMTPPSWLLISRPRPLMTPAAHASAASLGAAALAFRSCLSLPGLDALLMERELRMRAAGARTAHCTWEAQAVTSAGNSHRSWPAAALQRTGGQSVVEAKGVAQRIDVLAHPEVGGGAQRCRPQPPQHVLRRPDLQHA